MTAPAQKIVTIDVISRGQPRRYADHETRAEISVSYNGKPWAVSRSAAKEIARHMVHHFEDKLDPTNWAASKLKTLEPVGDVEKRADLEERAAKWRVLIVEPFTD